MSSYIFRNSEGETLVERLLHARGITNETEKQAFLNPDYESGTHDPYLLKDMDKVVQRISRAIDSNEKVCIYSDFDADGIPGAVVLHDCFKKIGFTNFENYIPDRHREGFGIHKHALDSIEERGVTLVISIDCGIADVESAKYAKEKLIDLIITDHHTPGDVLPDAYAIINPKQRYCAYPEKMLCGAGVIFKVATALAKKYNLSSGSEKWWLDMVGIATLSDMVPLLGENRIFAHFGLLVLKKTKRIGLTKLYASLKINPRHLYEEDVTFMITPRINAASRMANPMDAFTLLSTDSEAVAEEMVDHLNSVNNERKVQVAHLVKQIHKNVKERKLDEDVSVPVIVLGNPEWKPPVLGLAATNIVRDYNKPVFLWGRSEDGLIKGSCRAPDGVDIVSVMREIEKSIIQPGELFINMGGHSASGGFSLTEHGVHRFSDLLNLAYKKVYMSEPSLDAVTDSASPDDANHRAVYTVDALVKAGDIHAELWNSIVKLSPYGEANPKPLLVIQKVLIVEKKLFGKTKEHLEITCIDQQTQKRVKGIQFFATQNKKLTEGLGINDIVDVLGYIEKSMFKSYPEYRLRVVDVLK
jgi:single-stranded-DNA-specific exonuclease